MNSRAFTLSLIIALIAGFMVYSYIDGKEAEYRGKYGNLVPTVIAKVDINELDLIDDRKVQVTNVPENFVSPGAFKSIEELYNTIATVPILKGEQITKPRITYPGAQSGLARQISVGKRAMSINVGEEQSVSKLLKPGDRVDVLAMIDYASGKMNMQRVRTVLQDVYILSTGLNVTNSIPLVGMQVDDQIKKLNLNRYIDYSSVTLELTPYDAQKLVLIIASGAKLYLSLRNSDDNKPVPLQSTKLFDILDNDAAEAKQYFMKMNQKDKGRE